MFGSFRKIIAGVVSIAIAIGTIPPLQVFSGSIDSMSVREAYEGYDDTNVDYKVFDESMTPSMDWYYDAMGTEDDPYILDSAEDLYALHYITQSGGREFAGTASNNRIKPVTSIYQAYRNSVYIPNDATNIEDVYIIRGTNEYVECTDTIEANVTVGITSYYGSSNRRYMADVWFPSTSAYVVRYTDFATSAYIPYSSKSKADQYTWVDAWPSDEDVNNDGYMDVHVNVYLTSPVTVRTGSRSYSKDYTGGFFHYVTDDNGNTISAKVPYVDPRTEDHFVTATNLAGRTVTINLNDEVPAGCVYYIPYYRSYGTLLNSFTQGTAEHASAWKDSVKVNDSFWNKTNTLGAALGSGELTLYTYPNTAFDVTELETTGAILFEMYRDYDTRLYAKKTDDKAAWESELFYADAVTKSEMRAFLTEHDGRQVLKLATYDTQGGFLGTNTDLLGTAEKKTCYLAFDEDLTQYTRLVGYRTNSDSDAADYSVPADVIAGNTLPSAAIGGTYYTYYIYSFLFEDENGVVNEIKPTHIWNTYVGVDAWREIQYYSGWSNETTAYNPGISICEPVEDFYEYTLLYDCGEEFLMQAFERACWTSVDDGHLSDEAMTILGADFYDNDLDSLREAQQEYKAARDTLTYYLNQVDDPTFEDKHFKVAADFKWDGPSAIMTDQYSRAVFKGNIDFDGHIVFNTGENPFIQYTAGDIKNAYFSTNTANFIINFGGNMENITLIAPGCFKSVCARPCDYDVLQGGMSFINSFNGTATKQASLQKLTVIRNIGYGISLFNNISYADIDTINILFVDDAVVLNAPSHLNTHLSGNITSSIIKNIMIDSDSDMLGNDLNAGATSGTVLAWADGFLSGSIYSSSIEDVWVKDFNIPCLMSYYRYFWAQECMLNNITIEYDTVYPADLYGCESQALYLSRSTGTNLKLVGSMSAIPGQISLYDANIQNCEIGFSLVDNEYRNSYTVSSPFYVCDSELNTCRLFMDNAAGSNALLKANTFFYESCNSGSNYKDVTFDFPISIDESYCVLYTAKANFDNCTFNYGTITATSSYGSLLGYYSMSAGYHSNIKNSTVHIQKLISPKSALLGAVDFENTNVYVDEISNLWSLGIGTKIDDAVIKLNYASEVFADASVANKYDFSCCDIVNNTEIIVTAPDDATGEMYAPINLYKAENVFVCMDLKNTEITVIPKASYYSPSYPNTIFGSACYVGTYYMEQPGITDGTFIFKGKLKKNNCNLVSMLGYIPTSSQQCQYNNVTVFADIESVMGFENNLTIAGITTQSNKNFVQGLNLLVNSDSNPNIDGIFYMNNGSLLADAISVVTNSASKKQSLVELWYATSNISMVVSNSLLYTPNNLADYAGETSGVLTVGLTFNQSSPTLRNAAAAWYASDYSGVFHNCYVGKGQSKQYYDGSGDSIDMSSFNSNFAASHPDVDWSVSADKEYQGIKELEAENILSGEASYLLDKGYAYNRRGYNWTVYDEVNIIDPQTSNIITTIPAHTGAIGMYVPEQYLGDAVLADEPIYKLTINPAVDGEICVTGLQDISTSDGSVYVKRGSSLNAQETPYNDEVSLIYALESLNGGSDIRIPNQNAAGITTYSEVLSVEDNGMETQAVYSLNGANNLGYSIDGYKLPGADISITPVFKIARDITIDVNDAEHGTIIPSEYVSAEGEKVYLTLASDSGYMISNIYWNTVSDPDTTYSVSPMSMELIMPADDIVIHGTVSPMECGITKFSVLGFDGVIDQLNGTIDVWVPRIGQLNHVVPDVTFFGDYMTPSESSFVDLTTPCTYTVYKDSAEKSYTVNVHQSEYSMRIYSFKLNGVEGEINQASKQIIVRLPLGTDISSLTPDIIYSAETILPAEEEAQDFRMPIVYTLYATDVTPVPYTVEVILTASDDAIITNYSLSGYDGVIDEAAKEIVVTVPAALNLNDIKPSLIEYVGKTITPGKLTGINAVTPVEYTVTAQDDTVVTYTLRAEPLSDNTAKITKFELGGVEGTIDETTHKISVVVPSTTVLVDVAPDVLLYEGKSIYPNKTLIQDFSQPVEYTVVAVDNTEVTYTVEVTKLSNAAIITEFSLYNIDGIIDQVNKTISVELPYGYAVDNLVPTKLVYSAGATLTPAKTVARDFTNPVIYRVVSEDGTVTNDYVVTVTNHAMYDNLITKYTLDGVDGIITNIGADRGIINLTIKEKYPAVDYTNICPDEILISEFATINHDRTVAMDFINNVPTYTVTGLYNGARTYEVYLTVVPMDTTAKITSFEAAGHIGVIDEDAGTITITAAERERETLKTVVPNITWEGKSISPEVSTQVDLTQSLSYIVYAEHPQVSKTYEVVVNWLQSDCIITDYAVKDIVADINQETGDMTLRIPKSRKTEFECELVPSRVIWLGNTLTPDEATAVNIFAEPTYVVSSDDGLSKTYTVKPKVYDDIVLPDTCIITAYSFNGVAGRINQQTGVITIDVPKAKKSEFSVVKAPDYIIWEGATLSPVESAAVDIFDSPKYVVTAESGATKTYVVKANVITPDIPVTPIPPGPSDDCIITRYEVVGVKGEIDQAALTITLNVPLSKKDALTNVVPDKIEWRGKTLLPTERTAVTIIDGLTYKVTAESGKQKTYIIKLNWVDDRDDDCIITYYEALGISGRIDQNALTITMSIPLSKRNAVENVVPDRIIWRGKTISPAEQSTVTLADGLTYTVTAENGKQKTYTIRIEWTDDRSDDCIITYYKAAGVVGAIDQSNLTITMLVPLSKQDKLENIVPDEIKWRGETLTPDEDDTITLEDGLTYTVTAENGSWKTYTIKIEWIDDRDVDCIITAYKVCGINAEINQDDLTINLEIPESRKQHCTNIAPDVVAWYGSKLVPSETNGVDLTEDLVYRVYAENTDIYKDYTVNVKWLEEPTTNEPGPDDEPSDNPYTGVPDDRLQYMRILLAMLMAAGVVVSFRKRKQ